MYGPLLSEIVREHWPELAGFGAGAAVYDTIPPRDWDKMTAGKSDFRFVVFQNVGGVPTYFTEGDYARKRNARLQITVWCNTPRSRFIESDKLLRILSKHPQFQPLTEIEDDYDNALKLYGARFDVSCWYDVDYP